MRKTFWAPAKISFVLIFNLTGRRHGEEMKAFMSFLFKTLSERGDRLFVLSILSI